MLTPSLCFEDSSFASLFSHKKTKNNEQLTVQDIVGASNFYLAIALAVTPIQDMLLWMLLAKQPCRSL